MEREETREKKGEKEGWVVCLSLEQSLGRKDGGNVFIHIFHPVSLEPKRHSETAGGGGQKGDCSHFPYT